MLYNSGGVFFVGGELLLVECVVVFGDCVVVLVYIDVLLFIGCLLLDDLCIKVWFGLDVLCVDLVWLLVL